MKSVRPISVIGKQRVGQANSVGPIRSFRWDRNVMKGKQGVCIANSVGPVAHLGQTETLRRGNREFAVQSRWDRSLILVGPKRYEGKQRGCNPISVRPRSLSVRPICLGFVAVAMTSETRWLRIERIGGAEFDFWFRSYEDVGRQLRVLEHITKHFEQVTH